MEVYRSTVLVVGDLEMLRLFYLDYNCFSLFAAASTAFFVLDHRASASH